MSQTIPPFAAVIQHRGGTQLVEYREPSDATASPGRGLPEPAFELWHLLLKSEIATLEGVTWQSGLRPPVALKDQQARKASIDAHVLGLARQFYDELGPRTSEGAMPPRGMYARSRGVERAV